MSDSIFFRSDATHTGWMQWSPRPEISPAFSIPAKGGRTGQSALCLSGNSNSAVYGGWRRQVDGIKPGQPYRFGAWCRTMSMSLANQHATARLDWLDAAGKRLRAPDNAISTSHDGEWQKFEHTTIAPEQ